MNSKFGKDLAILCIILMLTACGGGGGSDDDGSTNVSGGGNDSKVCDTVHNESDVYVINLSQDLTLSNSCAKFADKEDVAQCIEDRIRAEFANAPGCLNAFDVFVPGTTQETGDYKQFTSIISDQPGRTYLSLQYRENHTLPGSWLDILDYSGGVEDASESLDVLLYTLKTRFDTTDIRVFGHSKGSEAVADVSLFVEHDKIKFYAFAQPGITNANVKGKPGYIQKLTNNLVAITWQNDEVQYYTGGLLPEIWGWPGYINQEGGGATLQPTDFRIDHHNNYGGRYTKTEKDHPYCATGYKTALDGKGDSDNKGEPVNENECTKKSGVKYLPYFWGDADCTTKAYEMMETGMVGDEHYIGHSGPRAPVDPNNPDTICKHNTGFVSVDYTLRYKMTPADQHDCKSQLDISLWEWASYPSGRKIIVSSTVDTDWIEKTGTIEVPLHMELALYPKLEQVPKKDRLFAGDCWSAGDSEIYIDYFMVEFTHPETGEPGIKRTLIGLDEGQGYLTTMVGRPNVAWNTYHPQNNEFDLQYGISALFENGAVMAKGPTKAGNNGAFHKWVHLVD